MYKTVNWKTGPAAERARHHNKIKLISLNLRLTKKQQAEASSRKRQASSNKRLTK